MWIVVDSNRCQSNAQRVCAAPTVFRMYGEESLECDYNPDEALRERVEGGSGLPDPGNPHRSADEGKGKLMDRSNGEPEPAYILGKSEAETRRLIRQSRFHNPFTRRLLEDAGISEGMKVLDVGTGAGDVAMLAADLVGPKGSVVGVDRDPSVLEVARKRASEAGLTNVTFIGGDLESRALGEDFDAVVGRFVLIHLPDPVRALGSLVARVRSGGIVAFQDMNLRLESAQFCPPTPLWQKYWEWSQALLRFGGEAEMGYKLYQTYLAAGLPAPEMQLEAAVGGGSEWGGYEHAAETLRSLLPMVVKLGIAAEEEVDIDTLAERLRKETVAAGGVVKSPEVVSAWACKP